MVLDILLEQGYEVLGFVDDDPKKHGSKINGLNVSSDWVRLTAERNIAIALGIGNNAIRKIVYEKVKSYNLPVVTAIHPRAIVAKDVVIGEGVVIMPGAIVNSGCILEDGVVVNTGASVDHDCFLECFCQIWPGANLAGTIRVGAFSYVGTGASVIQNLKIGREAMIGAGAAVISDVADKATVVGVPAREIKNQKK